MSEPTSELENALKGLAPAPATLDRDRLMFLAGQSSRRGGLVWKAASGLFAVVSLVLAMFLALRPPAEIRIVHVIVPGPSPKDNQISKPHDNPGIHNEPAITPNLTLPDLAYHRLQQQILRFGVDGLPALPNPGPPLNEPPVTVERIGKQSPTNTGLNLFPWQ